MPEMLHLDEHGQPDYRINFRLRRDRAVDELLGLARGMIADGVLAEAEACELATWATRNPDLCSTFPGKDLLARLVRIYDDGRVDEDERAELRWFLESLAGEPELSDTPVAGGTTTLPLTQPPPDITHQGSLFVVSGRFLCGCRRLVTDRLKRLGAVVQKSITMETNFASRFRRPAGIGSTARSAAKSRRQLSIASAARPSRSLMSITGLRASRQ